MQAGTSVDHRGYAQSTYLYAVNGMVFEVMKEGALATLTLFETP